jgi:hypothetical protein
MKIICPLIALFLLPLIACIIKNTYSEIAFGYLLLPIFLLQLVAFPLLLVKIVGKYLHEISGVAKFMLYITAILTGLFMAVISLNSYFVLFRIFSFSGDEFNFI